MPTPISQPMRCRADGIARQARPPIRYETAAEFGKVGSPGQDDHRAAENDDHPDHARPRGCTTAAAGVRRHHRDQRKDVAEHDESGDAHRRADRRSDRESGTRPALPRAAARWAGRPRHSDRKMSCGSTMNVVCIAGSLRSGGAMRVSLSPKKAAAGESARRNASTQIPPERAMQPRRSITEPILGSPHRHRIGAERPADLRAPVSAVLGELQWSMSMMKSISPRK